MFREKNHGNVSGILTLEIWKEKKSGTSKTQVAVDNQDSVFSSRNAKNAHELSALINTLSTSS